MYICCGPRGGLFPQDFFKAEESQPESTALGERAYSDSSGRSLCLRSTGLRDIPQAAGLGQENGGSRLGIGYLKPCTPLLLFIFFA